MQLTVQCNCGKQLLFDDTAQGDVRCPSCGQSVPIITQPETKEFVPLEAAPPARSFPNVSNKTVWIAGGTALVLLLACLIGISALRRQEPESTATPKPQPIVDPAIDQMAEAKTSPKEADVVQPPVADAWAVGTSDKWTGELERIWGIVGAPGELHFKVRLATPLNGREYIEAFVNDDAFAREVLDYETREEWIESGETTNAGDSVNVAGVVAATTEIEYRITPREIPLVRLSSIERVGDADSRALVNGPSRSVGTFRHPLDSRSLINVLRVAPDEGTRLNLKGLFQGWLPESETVCVALGAGGRAAEVHFEGTKFSHYKPGERVEITATTTGRVYRRVVSNVVHDRPYLLGSQIRRPEVPGDELLQPTEVNSARSTALASTDSPPTLAQHAPSDEDKETIRKPTTAGSPAVSKTSNRGTEIFIVSEEGKAALQAGSRWLELHLPTLFPRKIKCVFVDSHGACWLGGEGGVIILDGESVRTCALDDGFPQQTISCIFEDAQGAMWVASWGDGIACLKDDGWRTREPGSSSDKDRWQVFKRSEGLCRDDVNALTEDRAGRLWIGTNSFKTQDGVPPGGGISVLLNERFQDGLLPETIARLQVQSMTSDTSGRVYIGVIGGVLMITPDLTAKAIGVAQGLPQRTPQALHLDSRSRLWAGTWGGGVVQLDSQTLSVSSDLALKDAKFVRRIAEDQDGVIWAASLQGLWKLDEEWNRVETPDAIQKIAVVAAIPKQAAESLQRFARASTREVTKRPEPSHPPTSPSNDERKRKTGKRKKRLNVFLDGETQPFTIYLNIPREFLLEKLGQPLVTQSLSVQGDEHIIDMYARAEPGPSIHVLMVGYGANEKVEFLENKHIAATSTKEQIEKEVNKMLTAHTEVVQESTRKRSTKP